MSFFDELKRRNVIRVGVAYLVASWLLLQIAEVLAPILDLPLAASKYAFLLLAIGFIPVLIFAWAYEMTPEGLKRESEVEHDASVTHQTAARLDRITIGLVVAAIAVVAIDRMIPEQGSDPLSVETVSENPSGSNEERALTPDIEQDSEPSVAVLPFVNMSSDPEQEFFSDGISEEILNVLTRIPNLKVAARTSSFQFKGQNLDIADIGRQLRVNHVLEGSVRKAGLQLRITAQLVETKTGFHLWSETFDRKLEDVFAIQDEIAAAIAGELRERLTTETLEASKVVNLEAYELYLKSRSMVATRKENELFAAIELLKSVIEVEPEYASAMATMARAFVVLPYFTDLKPAGELREQARHWANETLRVEPYNAEALAVLGVVYNEVDLNPVGALEVLHKAVTANPGSLAANNFLGDVALRTGDLDTALIHEARAAELDPLSPVHLSDLGNVYWLTGNYEKAVEHYNRALALNPTYTNAHWPKIRALFALGDMQNLEFAVSTTIESMNLNGSYRRAAEVILVVASGNIEQAKKIFAENFELAIAGKFPTFDTAINAVIVGDFDKAGIMLNQAIGENDGLWTFPLFVRSPEQAPGSEPWQEFWRKPGPAEFARLRRENGLNPYPPKFGEGAPK